MVNVIDFPKRYAIIWHDETKEPTFQKEEFANLQDALRRFHELDEAGLLPVLITSNPPRKC